MPNRHVVFVGSLPIGAQNATGQTLESLYRDRAKDSIRQFLVSSTWAGDEEGMSRISIWSAPIDAILRSPQRFAQRSGRRVSHAGNGLNDAIPSHRSSLRLRINRLIRVLLDVSPVRLPQSVRVELDEFRPEVIHSLFGNVRTMRLAYLMSKYANIPIVPHFMDDWVTTLYADGVLFGIPRRIALKCFERVLSRSPVLLTIGDAMANEFSLRYERQSYVAAYGVDKVVPTGPRVWGDTGIKNLVYTGGLHLGRAEVISRIGSCLQGTDWMLTVHESPARNWIPDQASIRRGEYLSVEDVPGALARADALLFVESFLPDIENYTRLSVSTKVSQYLASGRPILAVGPQNQASISALEFNSSHIKVINSMVLEALEGVMEFLESLDEASSNLLPLREEFYASTMRQNMEAAFHEAAAKWVL